MRLRKLEQKDAKYMLEWMHDKSVVHHLNANFAAKGIDDCRKFIEASRNCNADLNMAIVDDDDIYMGTVSLKHIDIQEKTAEFAITIRKSAMGKGYSGYGMKEILRIGFEQLGLDSIVWCVSIENKRAIRFYDKNGYHRIENIPDLYTKYYSQEQQKSLIWYEEKIVRRDEKMSKVLSVSIAAYNVEKYLSEVLDCFLEEIVQERCEIIVVSDGSTDATADIAKKYVNKYPNTFVLVEKENGGWGSTLNAAMKIAKGKYFKQLDGDDLFEIKNLPIYLEMLEKKNADVIITPYMSFDDKTGKQIEVITEAKELEREKEFIIADIAEHMDVAMHACAFKTEVLRKGKVELTERCFYTDVEFTLKSLNCSKTVEFIDVLIYKYRLSRDGQSVSHIGLKKHYLEHYKVLMGLLQYEENQALKKYIPFFEKRLYEMVKIQYAIFMMLEPSKLHHKEFKEFDKSIKDKYPKYYQVKSKKLSLLRASNFYLYNLLVR